MLGNIACWRMGFIHLIRHRFLTRHIWKKSYRRCAYLQRRVVLLKRVCRGCIWWRCLGGVLYAYSSVEMKVDTEVNFELISAGDKIVTKGCATR
jgi:hypothetical protein